MNKLLIVGLVALTITGCANIRSSVGDSLGLNPKTYTHHGVPREQQVEEAQICQRIALGDAIGATHSYNQFEFHLNKQAAFNRCLESYGWVGERSR